MGYFNSNAYIGTNNDNSIGAFLYLSVLFFIYPIPINNFTIGPSDSTMTPIGQHLFALNLSETPKEG